MIYRVWIKSADLESNLGQASPISLVYTQNNPPMIQVGLMVSLLFAAHTSYCISVDADDAIDAATVHSKAVLGIDQKGREIILARIDD